ncbi:hypothetical protein ACFE04_002150 [Oxalis oulophora]
MSRERFRRAALPPAQYNIEKLEKVIEEGNFYGAEQMYKSTSVRYILARRYSDAMDLLHSGACLQLTHSQVTCGAELAVLYVDTLVKANIPYDNDSLERLSQIYRKFPRIPVPHDLGADDDVEKLAEALTAAKTRVECCSSFLKAAIKWSAESGAHRNGSPELHSMLAEYLYSQSPEMDMAKVSYHFVRANDPEKFLSTLLNFMGKCYPGEDDLAIARAILMYLAMGNLRDANCLMDEVKEHVECDELEFPESDLIEFICYLLPTLQRDAFPLFHKLRQLYKTSIDREPSFYEMLDDIAEKFYGVQRKNHLQGMFGDIFKVITNSFFDNTFSLGY